MKLISLAVSALAGLASAQKTSKGDTFVILSPPVTQMTSLKLDLTQVKKAFGLPASEDLTNPTPAQEKAMNHLEVQLKHIFWLTHDYKSKKLEDIQAAWLQFQQEIIDYGCHCFTTGYTVGGSGPAQDKIDLACKEYSRCIRCIDIDRVETDHFSDREKECTVHQPYFSKLKKDPSSPNKFVLCGRGADEGGRQSNCQVANCKCDVQFASAVAAWWNKRNSDLQGIYNGGLGTVCVNEQPNVGPPDGCCGAYPDRRAYWTVNGRGCCGNAMAVQNVFYIAEKTCCGPENGELCDKTLF